MKVIAGKHIIETNNAIRFLKNQTDSVLIYYSGGKDSLCMLDLFHRAGFKVKLVHLYFVKGLEHVQKYIRWAENKYNVECIQLPHFMLCQMFNDNYFRFPTVKVSNIKWADIDSYVRNKTGIEWIAMGIKQADSLNRRLMLRGYLMNSICIESKKVYPLSFWKKGDCLSYIRHNKMPMPISYSIENSSGVDLTFECLTYLKEHYPGDYQKIINVFPFAETIIKSNPI